jgi:hypothetical protein
MEGMWRFAPIRWTSWIVNRLPMIESDRNINVTS